MVETTEGHIKNETERSLVRFEANRIFSSEWPSSNGGKVIQALGHQLRFAGGFHAHMEVIDLDTPTNVRLDTEKVLRFLKTKPPITSVQKLVIPNVGKLTSSDQVKDVVGKFCTALGTPDKPVSVQSLTLPCDEVSNDFYSGNINWIDQFYSSHGVKRVDIPVS